MKINKTKEKGQVVLMVLLVSALMLTIGLSVSKNTVTETKVDTDEDLLKQAFNTAESGVEYYLATGSKQYFEDNSSAAITTMDIGNQNEINSGGVVLNGEPFLFWLVNHNTNDKSIGDERFTGNINQICVDSNFTGGLKIDLFSFNGTTYSINRLGYNMNSSNSVNGFSQINGNCTGIINVSNGMLLVVTPIGGNTKIVVNGDTTFPSQGEEITSVGQMNSGVNTKITVLNRFNEIPPFMLDAIVSGDSVLSQ